MSGLANNSIGEFRDRINRFKPEYVLDWNEWISVYSCNSTQVPVTFGKILRKWQACRPNTMRRPRQEALHAPPCLDDLINDAQAPLRVLDGFDLSQPSTLTSSVVDAMTQLWGLFEKLSYRGKARGGLAGVVGISKSVMMLTRGSFGPAFDANVRQALGVWHIYTPADWIDAIKVVGVDIQEFERRNGISILEATPFQYRNIAVGRIYDMALGPRA